MSRYLIVIHDDSAAAVLDGWLALRSSPVSEQWSTRVNGTFSLRIVSPQVDDAIRGRSFFTGVATSETAGYIAFGSTGWQQSERARSRESVAPSGSFVHASWSRNEVRIGNDLFGTLPLLEAHGPGFVAFSDSLAVLADLRDRFGLVNTPNREALLARTGLSWRTAQVSSTDTMVREVSMVAPGRGVTVQCTRPLLVDADETSLATLLEDGPSAVESARTAVGFLVSTVRGLPRAHRTSLHLSSARDVLLLAALERAGTPDLTITSGPDAPADLGRRGAEHEPEFMRELSDRPGLTGWAASALGLSDVVAPSDSTTADDDSPIAIDSAGNTIARRVWGSETADGLRDASGLASTAAEAYFSQVSKGLRAIGADPTSPSASQQHYAAFRSPRYVASARSGRLAVHPLHTRSSAAVSPIAHRFDRADGLDVFDTLLGGPSVAAPSATDAGRTVLSLAELGGPLQDSEIPDLDVYGTAAEARSTQLAIGVAAARGLDGSVVDRSVLVDSMQDLVGVLPVDLLPTYEPLLDNARWHLMNRQEPLSVAGPSVGKLLSLVLFAN